MSSPRYLNDSKSAADLHDDPESSEAEDQRSHDDSGSGVPIQTLLFLAFFLSFFLSPHDSAVHASGLANACPRVCVCVCACFVCVCMCLCV